MKQIIQVTAEDIKAGWQQSYWRLIQQYKKHPKREMILKERAYLCPVAIALNKLFGKRCVADTYRLYIDQVAYRTPEVVSDWIYDFDKGFEEMQPFNFELDLEQDKWQPPVWGQKVNKVDILTKE